MDSQQSHLVFFVPNWQIRMFFFFLSDFDLLLQTVAWYEASPRSCHYNLWFPCFCEKPLDRWRVHLALWLRLKGCGTFHMAAQNGGAGFTFLVALRLRSVLDDQRDHMVYWAPIRGQLLKCRVRIACVSVSTVALAALVCGCEFMFHWFGAGRQGFDQNYRWRL